MCKGQCNKKLVTETGQFGSEKLVADDRKGNICHWKLLLSSDIEDTSVDTRV